MARTTGLIYLTVIVTGLFSLAYVPSQLIVSSDAALTVSNIRNAPGLFRLGIAAGFVCYLAFLLLPFGFYRLMGHASRTAAILMLAFAVTSVPISLANLGNKLDVLTLLGNKPYLSAISAQQIDTAVMLALARYGGRVRHLRLAAALRGSQAAARHRLAIRLEIRTPAVRPIVEQRIARL